MTFNRFLLLLLITTSVHTRAQFTDVINSNRPGESMGAFSVGKTVFQAEFGVYFSDEDHATLNYDAAGFGSDLQLRYGAFFEQLEFILDLQYQRDNFQSGDADYTRSGLRQANIGGKFLIYDPNKNYTKKPDLYSWKRNHAFSWRELIPAIGAYGGLNFNLFDNPYVPETAAKASPKFMLLTQNQFGKWVLVLNGIVDNMFTNEMNYGYIVTVTRGINPRWSAFVENQGFQSDTYADGIFRAGAAFLILEHIQIDAFVGRSIKDTPSLFNAGLGLSWRFDLNYTDVYLRAPDKDEDKGKDKKKEKEKKKRKDAVETEQPTE